MPFECFIRDMDRDIEFREHLFQHSGCFIDDLVTAFTAGYATEEQEIFQRVEIGVVRDGIAQINSHCPVDCRSARIIFTAGFLHKFEDLRQRSSGGKIKTGRFDQTADRPLLWRLARLAILALRCASLLRWCI